MSNIFAAGVFSDEQEEPDGHGFICCPACGKRLIRKTKTGRLHFVFGKCINGSSPVEMYVEGKIKIKCLRHRSCGAWVTVE